MDRAAPLYAGDVDTATLIGLGNTVWRTAMLPTKARNALWSCFENALEDASADQRLNGDAISAITIEVIKNDPAWVDAALSIRFEDPMWQTNWANTLLEALSATELDLTGTDLEQFTNSAFEAYISALSSEAQKPDSKLTNAVIISKQNAISTGAGSPGHDTPAGPFSNLWKRPRPATIHERPSVRTVKEHLASHGSAHLCGEPGSGKSMVARLVADSVGEADVEKSVWWMDGSTREALEASCVELCSELGITPGDDVLTQTKTLLARHGDWLVVIDDLGTSIRTDAVIPSSTSSVQVLVTSRSPLGSGPDELVMLDDASEELMRAIAHDALSGTVLDGTLDLIIEACDENPLAIATVCRFLSSTGATVDEVLELLDEQPDIVLDEELGGQYPRTFTKVVTSALVRLHGSISEEMLTALAVCGGRLRRGDLEMITSPNDRLGFLNGHRELRALGLVEASDELLSCHALVASVVVRRAREQLVTGLPDRVLAHITSEVGRADSIGLHEYVRIADSLPVDTPSDTVTEFAARKTLATHLSLFGLGRTADRQLHRARAILDRSPDPTLSTLLTVTEAAVQFQRGEITETERLARTALEELADRPVDREVKRSIILQATLCLAQCRGYYEDWKRAAQYAQYAVEASDGDPEVKAVAVKLRVPMLDAPRRLAAFLDLAETDGISDTSRAESLALASRAALDLEDADQAVRCAREALAIDRVTNGPDSQFTARDLNDLGNALFEAGEFDEAARHLEEAIKIYEAELPEHAYAAQPRMHLARVLTEKVFQDDAPSPRLLEEALQTLEPALSVQRRIAPKTVMMSSLLVAQANATVDHAAAIAVLSEALEIDRELYGDGHPEVCIDVVQLASRHAASEEFGEASDVLEIAVPHVQDWESERPSLAVNVLSLLLLCRYVQTGTQEPQALRDRLKRLMTLIPPQSAEHRQAEEFLALGGPSSDGRRP